MRSRVLTTALAAAFVLAFCAGASAQPPARSARQADSSDLLLRINAPVTVAAADSVSTLWVIAGDALVEGTVREQLIVMGGTARVTGVVRGGVAVFGGVLELGPDARVGGDVFLFRSTLVRAPGAAVAGAIEYSRGPAFGQGVAFAFWLSMTLVVVCVGLLVTAIGRPQLGEAAATLTRRPGASVVAAAVVWGAAPLVAAFSFATLVGIPLGFAIVLVLLPALGFAGLVVAAAALGGWLLGTVWQLAGDEHPYRAVALGLLAFQAVGFVPVVGALLVLAAGAAGAGALVYRAWSGWRQRRRGRVAVPELVPAGAH
jgi:hypothetical protein